ncbi:MAG: type II toxin-antitoxin system VapC family toxin [Planctomycetota bacterium]|nr:type II toxin-antitoxin system VapC family toxin [Planctomycetota bacterium]
MTTEPPKRYYVDTSAYLCVILGEDGHEEIAQELSGAFLFSSALLVLESTRNLIRLSREGNLRPADLERCLSRLESDIAVLALRDLTLELCQGRTMPVVSTPRSLDLAHLRTALWFHAREPLTRFVTLDQAQVQAARELGLPV